MVKLPLWEHPIRIIKMLSMPDKSMFLYCREEHGRRMSSLFHKMGHQMTNLGGLLQSAYIHF